MKYISDSLQDYSKIIISEIENDSSEYYWPKSPQHQIFEQAFMKFVNGNLNYFSLDNMIAHSVEENEFNPAFRKTLEFCEYVRTLTGDRGPYGRMCVWNIPPGKKLLPHQDRFRYHYHIIRNIFVVSENVNDLMKINIAGNKVIVKQGTLFQFQPALEIHEFINDSDKPFYFLGFDYWNESMHEYFKLYHDIKSIINNPVRTSGYGAAGTEFKYMSKH